MILTLVFSIVAVLFSLSTCIFSILAYTKVVGLQNSTHKIQYMPMPGPEQVNQDEPDDLVEKGDMVEKGGGVDKKLLRDFKEKMYPDISDEYV
jgi:hypothetical protein